MKDALCNLPKAIAEFRNPPLPTIETVEDSYEEVSNGLEDEGVKIIITFK